MTDLQFDIIERFRDHLGRGNDEVWYDGDDIGWDLRKHLDELIAEVKRLRRPPCTTRS